MSIIQIDEANVKTSSRPVPCFDRQMRKVRWFTDQKGEVWLNAHDLCMGKIGVPNTCGNCANWKFCKVKDRDSCPADFGWVADHVPTEAELQTDISEQELQQALIDGCQASYDRIQAIVAKMEQDKKQGGVYITWLLATTFGIVITLLILALLGTPASSEHVCNGACKIWTSSVAETVQASNPVPIVYTMKSYDQMYYDSLKGMSTSNSIIIHGHSFVHDPNCQNPLCLYK